MEELREPFSIGRWRRVDIGSSSSPRSRVLKRAPAQYAKAYLYTETDDNDLTYFIDHQPNVISEAIKELHKYLAEKTREIADTRRLIASSPKLKGKRNHRQLAAMEYLMKHSHVIYRIQEHQTANGVTYETARTDLLELVNLGLLEKHREGNSVSGWLTEPKNEIGWRRQFYFTSLVIASAALPATTQLADPATTASSSNHRNPKSSMHSGKSGLMIM
jgi:hypothetical protein